MNKISRFELIEIFDIYKELLTKKQIEYFIDYFFNDLSLFEIANKYNISRNAILDSIKNTEKNLLNFEKILNIYKLKKEILYIIENNKNDIAIEKIKSLNFFKQ